MPNGNNLDRISFYDSLEREQNSGEPISSHYFHVRMNTVDPQIKFASRQPSKILLNNK